MSKIHLCIPDQHAHSDYSNDRADWLAQLIIDLKPDVVINMGDAADMPSLASYDKGKRSYYGKAYSKDIEAHLDFQERLWQPVKLRKKKLPRAIVLEGNHEQRIERALDLSPELEGTVGFNDLDFDRYYSDVVRYNGGTPGVIEVDGVYYAHYFISGVMGRSISGLYPAAALLAKQHASCTQGHSHIFDFTVHTNVRGDKLFGAVCGVYQDYDSDWAGNVNKLWHRGVLIKHNVENGTYDPQWVSLEALRKAYGG